MGTLTSQPFDASNYSTYENAIDGIATFAHKGDYGPDFRFDDTFLEAAKSISEKFNVPMEKDSQSNGEDKTSGSESQEEEMELPIPGEDSDENEINDSGVPMESGLVEETAHTVLDDIQAAVDALNAEPQHTAIEETTAETESTHIQMLPTPEQPTPMTEKDSQKPDEQAAETEGSGQDIPAITPKYDSKTCEHLISTYLSLSDMEPRTRGQFNITYVDRDTELSKRNLKDGHVDIPVEFKSGRIGTVGFDFVLRSPDSKGLEVTNLYYRHINLGDVSALNFIAKDIRLSPLLDDDEKNALVNDLRTAIKDYKEQGRDKIGQLFDVIERIDSKNIYIYSQTERIQESAVEQKDIDNPEKRYNETTEKPQSSQDQNENLSPNAQLQDAEAHNNERSVHGSQQEKPNRTQIEKNAERGPNRVERDNIIKVFTSGSGIEDKLQIKYPPSVTYDKATQTCHVEYRRGARPDVGFDISIKSVREDGKLTFRAELGSLYVSKEIVGPLDRLVQEITETNPRLGKTLSGAVERFNINGRTELGDLFSALTRVAGVRKLEFAEKTGVADHKMYENPDIDGRPHRLKLEFDREGSTDKDVVRINLNYTENGIEIGDVRLNGEKIKPEEVQDRVDLESLKTSLESRQEEAEIKIDENLAASSERNSEAVTTDSKNSSAKPTTHQELFEYHKDKADNPGHTLFVRRTDVIVAYHRFEEIYHAYKGGIEINGRAVTRTDVFEAGIHAIFRTNIIETLISRGLGMLVDAIWPPEKADKTEREKPDNSDNGVDTQNPDDQDPPETGHGPGGDGPDAPDAPHDPTAQEDPDKENAVEKTGAKGNAFESEQRDFDISFSPIDEAKDAQELKAEAELSEGATEIKDPAQDDAKPEAAKEESSEVAETAEENAVPEAQEQEDAALPEDQKEISETSDVEATEREAEEADAVIAADAEEDDDAPEHSESKPEPVETSAEEKETSIAPEDSPAKEDVSEAVSDAISNFDEILHLDPQSPTFGEDKDNLISEMSQIITETLTPDNCVQVISDFLQGIIDHIPAQSADGNIETPVEHVSDSGDRVAEAVGDIVDNMEIVYMHPSLVEAYSNMVGDAMEAKGYDLDNILDVTLNLSVMDAEPYELTYDYSDADIGFEQAIDYPVTLSYQDNEAADAFARDVAEDPNSFYQELAGQEMYELDNAGIENYAQTSSAGFDPYDRADNNLDYSTPELQTGAEEYQEYEQQPDVDISEPELPNVDIGAQSPLAVGDSAEDIAEEILEMIL